MEYKSELYETITPPTFLRDGEVNSTLTNVGVVIALTAIALSVAMIVTENFNGSSRLANDTQPGKSQPVADADALLAKLAALSESKTGAK
jgi:hypothetical protein